MVGATLLKGGTVLTLGAKTQNHLEGDVLIEDGRISEVGTGLRARGAEHIDATDTIVMPGFVDTHRHAWRSLFRNFGDGPPGSGQGLSPAAYGPHYGPDDVYAAVLISLLGATVSGITTVVDWGDFDQRGELTEAALQAHADSGIRSVLVHPELGGLDQQGDRTTLAFGSKDPKSGVVDQLADDWEAARKLGWRIHAHAGKELATHGVVAELGSRGLLGDDVTLIHCSHLDDPDVDAIASSGARVSLTPSSEMAGGLGSPPIQQLIDRGVRPGLGVDDERVAPGDMFAQMRAANSIQHATMFDLKLAGKAGLPTLLTTREVIRYATSDGSAAVGLSTTTGSIEPGKRADVIVLRADRPNIAPVNDPIGAVVWGMDTSNVDWVFVDGEALVSEGSLTRDSANARELATAAQRRVASAAGLLVEEGESR